MRLRHEIVQTAREAELFPDIIGDGVVVPAVVEHGRQGREDVGIHLAQGLGDAVFRGGGREHGVAEGDEKEGDLVDQVGAEEMSCLVVIMLEDGIGQDIEGRQYEVDGGGLHVALDDDGY